MKRGRIRIIAEMLQTAKDGAKKTRIQYKCNLSHGQNKQLLALLLKTGLVTIGNSYHTTEKGQQFIEAYNTLELLLNTEA